MQFRFLAYLILIFPSILSGAEQEKVITESVVIFNTICAKCHESQCSGRMNFQMAYEEIDMVVEDCYLSKDRQIVVPFTIEDASHQNVRLYPHKPVSMTQLVITGN